MNSRHLFIILLAAILGFLGGYLTRALLLDNQQIFSTANLNTSSNKKNGTGFNFDSSTINAKIIKINGNKLTIKNTRNEIIEYPLSPQARIPISPEKAIDLSIESNRNKIELNKDAMIQVVYENGENRILNIFYPQSVPTSTSLPPTTNPPPPAPK